MHDPLLQALSKLQDPLIAVRGDDVVAMSVGARKRLDRWFPRHRTDLSSLEQIESLGFVKDGIELFRLPTSTDAVAPAWSDDLPDALMEVELDGRVRFANRSARRIFHAEPNVTEILSLVAEPDRSRFKAKMGIAMAGRASSETYTLVSPHRARRYRVRMTPTAKRGRTLVIAEAADTSAQSGTGEPTQDRGLASQLAWLAGAIAHDLNNCLMTISGAMSGVQNGYLEAEDLELAQAGIHKAQGVGRDLHILAQGRVSSHGHVSSLQHAWEDLAAALSHHKVDMSGAKPVPAALRVAADRATIVRIREVVLERGLEGLPPNATGRLSWDVDEGRVGLHLTHDGPAPDSQLRAQLFDPFTFSVRGPQSGLGLTVVRAITLAHGGDMAVRIDNHKTTYSVWLPRHEASSAVPEHPTLRVPQRILLVDDEDLVRRSLGRMLTRMGAEVVQTASGIAALSALEHDSAFDLALVDMIMPGLSGEDLVKAMAKRVPDLHLVVMSGWTREERAQACLDAGAVAFLPKPFSIDALMNILRNARDSDIRPSQAHTG